MKRRLFLRQLFTLTSSLYGFKFRLWAMPAREARVAIARDSITTVGKYWEHHAALHLLDTAMQKYFDVDRPVEAWKKIVKKGETIAVKVNCLSGRGSTHTVLVEAVCERLQQAGIRASDIIIWDRLNRDLEEAGFRINTSSKGIRCFGNDTAGFENSLTVAGQTGSLVSMVTRICDGIINIGLLRDHSIAGVSLSMKNLFGAIHNPNKYHINNGNPFIAEVNTFPVFRRKIRLHIIDALEGQYQGGPAFMPQWRWPYGGILLSRDPVALDYTGWQIIEKERRQRGLPTLKQDNRKPEYIYTAERLGVGVADKNSIKIV